MATSTKRLLDLILFNALFWGLKEVLEHKDHKAFKEYKGCLERLVQQGLLEEYGEQDRVLPPMG
jgi:hypothetical protein